jgi:uncharacterized SAM-binding protein YcdF (DUF218 family)
VIRADAIVVLGCRVPPSGRARGAAARRAEAAAQAYLDGVAPVVITSGGRRWGAHVESSVLRRELVRLGVPDAAVVEELCSFSTYENAVFAAGLLRRLCARDAVIVTCAWHMDRALRNFRAAGINARPLPVRAPEAAWTTRVGRRVHEILSSLFDARAMRRAGVYAKLT